MHPINFLLKWFFNFLFWLITFMVLTNVIPFFVVNYASNAIIDPIDLKGLGAGKIFIGQLLACLVLLGTAWFVMKWDERRKIKKSEKPNTIPVVPKPDENFEKGAQSDKKQAVIPAIPRFIQEESFSVSLNFANVCLVISSFLDSSFIIYFFLGIMLSATIGFFVLTDE